MKKELSEKNSGWNRSNSPKTNFRIKEYGNQVHLVNGLGEVLTVGSKGSLALLSMGAVGYQAWKQAKQKDGE